MPRLTWLDVVVDLISDVTDGDVGIGTWAVVAVIVMLVVVFEGLVV